MTNTDTKKYRLIFEDYKIIDGRKLYRIEALKDFNHVKTGELGGYIESENNLSHEGNAWVYNDAKVYGGAKIFDNAIIGGKAQIYGNAKIYGNAWVYDNATACNNAWIRGRAKIYGNAWVHGNAKIRNNAWVYGSAIIEDNAVICEDARVYENAWVRDNAKIYGNAWVHGNAEIGNNAVISDKKNWFTVGPIGSRDDFTTFFLNKDGNIYVSCGCFCDNIDKFEKAVKKTHAGTKYEKDYRAAIALAKDKITIIDIEEKRKS
jgi:carbonic anhydrase/acetyltransferase-like protein (isoleucine patch superfamily)